MWPHSCTLKKEAGSSSETSIHSSKLQRHQIPGGNFCCRINPCNHGHIRMGTHKRGKRGVRPSLWVSWNNTNWEQKKIYQRWISDKRSMWSPCCLSLYVAPIFMIFGMYVMTPVAPVDRLCGLVVTVTGYRSRGPGFDAGCYQIFWKVVGLERSSLILVRITEKLLEWKSSGSGSRKSRLTAVGIFCIDHAKPSFRKSWH
jgi:hypothetical protein